MSLQIKKQNIYELVIEHLQQYILDNALRPGDRLPTEAELAEQFGVGRQAIREAMKVLESVGVVETRPRDGSRLKELNVRPLTEHLRFMLELDGVSLQEMATSRCVIECAVLPLVLENADETDFQRLADSIERMQQSFGDEARYFQADMDFHKALLKATKNRVMQGFGSVLHEFFMELSSRMVSTPEVKQKSSEDHQHIYQALRAKDVHTARQVMDRHLSVYNHFDTAIVTSRGSK